MIIFLLTKPVSKSLVRIVRNKFVGSYILIELAKHIRSGYLSSYNVDPLVSGFGQIYLTVKYI